MDRSGRLLRAEHAIAGARRLGRNRLVYDISVRPPQYEGLAGLAGAVPETTFVLGHMGKPAMRGEEEPDWRIALRRLAQVPNIICKITAHVLAPDDAAYDRRSVISRVRHCFDCFGFERVLFGSNYPTCLISTPLSAWLEIVEETLDGVSSTERGSFFAGNADRIYGLTGLRTVGGA